MSLPEPDNEWEYDLAARSAGVVDNFASRDGDLGALLHLRWIIGTMMKHVKMVHLTATELVALIAIMAPVRCRPVINAWDYDVRHRVADALRIRRENENLLDTECDKDSLLRLLKLRAELATVMTDVKITDLTVPELAAMLPIFAAPNGRRLLADTFEKTLRPILRLVDSGPDLGDAAAQLAVLCADTADEFTGTELATS